MSRRQDYPIRSGDDFLTPDEDATLLGDARAVAVALMRGDPRNFKAGYTAENAILAVTDMFELTPDEVRTLRNRIPGDPISVPARDLRWGDVLLAGGTITLVDVATTPGVVYVEVDWQHKRGPYNHGDPVKVYRVEGMMYRGKSRPSTHQSPAGKSANEEAS